MVILKHTYIKLAVALEIKTLERIVLRKKCVIQFLLHLRHLSLVKAI